MSRVRAWAGIRAFVAALTLGAGAASAGAGTANAATTADACSTRGLTVAGAGKSGYRVTALRVERISCTRARGVAKQVAEDLSHNRSVALARISGIAISSMSCTGCAPTTQVSVTYPNGLVTVSLRGSAATAPSSGPSPGGTVI